MGKRTQAGLILAVLAGLAIAGTAKATTTTTVITLSDDKMTGTFGNAVESGETTTVISKAHPTGLTTFDYTIVETLVDLGTFTYSYTNTTGDTAPSQVPPTPCIEEGCTPGETIPNGPALFSKPFAAHQPIPYGDGYAITQFEDGVYDYSGSGIQTETITTSSAPEPAGWALMLAGFAALGAAMRSRLKAVATTREIRLSTP